MGHCQTHPGPERKLQVASCCACPRHPPAACPPLCRARLGVWGGGAGCCTGLCRASCPPWMVVSAPGPLQPCPLPHAVRTSRPSLYLQFLVSPSKHPGKVGPPVPVFLMGTWKPAGFRPHQSDSPCPWPPTGCSEPRLLLRVGPAGRRTGERPSCRRRRLVPVQSRAAPTWAAPAETSHGWLSPRGPEPWPSVCRPGPVGGGVPCQERRWGAAPSRKATQADPKERVWAETRPWRGCCVLGVVT